MDETAKAQIRQLSIVGTPISLISLDRLLRLFEQWIADRHDRYVVFRDVHGVVAARNDASLDFAHRNADIVAPDGVPLVWALRATGINASRVCGPDTLSAACQYGLSRGWKHYFYGGAPGVAETVVHKLRKRVPGLSVVGISCPPFRQLTDEEDAQICSEIRAARPDLIWVCLGTPKQEIWMSEHRGKLGGAILLGVGAAIDFHAGNVRRAPRWMQRLGLEWTFRLYTDPRRLWRRYVLMAPQFAVLAAREVIQRRQSNHQA